MLRPRSAILVVFMAAVAWLGTVYVSSGLDPAAAQLELGSQFAEIGLPAFGSLFLGRASTAYRARVDAGQDADPATQEARQGFAESELALAELFRSRAKWSRAKHHYERAAHASVELAKEARCWAAYVEGAGGGAGAKRTLLGILVDEPDNPLPAYLVGQLFLNESKPEEARRYLERSLQAPDGESYDAHVALARLLAQGDERDEATQHAQRALEMGVTAAQKREAALLLDSLGAEAPHPIVLWLRTFASRHRWGLIGVALLVALLLYPTWLGLFGRLFPSPAALLYLVARSSEPAAIRCYEAAVRRWPDNARLLRALAEAYRRVGVGSTRAAELWERLHELRPADEQVRDRVVELTLECGRETDAALLACQGWFDQNPEHPDARIVAAHLARTYRGRRLTPPEAALPALRLAAEAASADRDLHAYVGALYSHYGHGAEAAAILSDLVEAAPDNEAYRLQYARALIGAGDAYGAYRHLRALTPSPEVTTDLYLAGIVAHGAGRYRESLRILQEVVRRDPGLFDVQQRVAEASVRTSEHRLDQFEVVENIVGQEACVLYRAVHPEHGEVVLLVFRRDFSDGPGFTEAFTRYLAESQRLVGGNAEVISFGCDQEEYYIAYAMPAGRPLSTVVEEHGSFDPDEAAQIMASVLGALQALHDGGRIHGDLRPSAVWLDEMYQATLVGAGASLIADDAGEVASPSARSPFHTAPEVVENRDLSAASDIYAAGCILYELLVGSPPLEGPTHVATMMAHVTIEPDPPSMRAPAVPPTIDDLVLRALSKDPARRPGSAEEFASELRELFPGAEAGEAEPLAGGESQPAFPAAGSEAASQALLEPPDPMRWWTYYADLSAIATARFAKVHGGVYRQTGEPHAIKHLQVPRVVSAGEGVRGPRAAQAVWRLFQSEMHVLQSLAEEETPLPGVTRMLQAYRADENNPAYAMPLMQETLAERISRDGRLELSVAIDLMRDLGAIVDGLHERGIAHRGVGPRSVMFDSSGRVCLGGFDGACRLADRSPRLLAEREAQHATHSPLYVFGDIRFLSPERCKGEDFELVTDVYSLGALLFYILSGKAPFEHADEMQVMLDHISAPPPRLHQVGITTSAGVQEVIDRAMAKSPADRFASARAMIFALTGGVSADR